MSKMNQRMTVVAGAVLLCCAAAACAELPCSDSNTKGGDVCERDVDRDAQTPTERTEEDACHDAILDERCEARTCTALVIQTPDDLANARACAEVQGDLTVTSAGLAAITSADLPHLWKITGNLVIGGLNNGDVEMPRLREVTLAKLRQVGGSLAVAHTGPGSVGEIRLPALTGVGGSVVVMHTETRLLELPALRTVGGGFYLAGLKHLCALEVGAIEEIAEALNFAAIYNLPASALEPLRRASAQPPVAENAIGCCLSLDNMCPEPFSTEERDAFCGCTVP